MLGGDHIVNDNERFNPTAGCSLEGPNEVGWTMHWEEQELKAELSARSFYCATAMSAPGLASCQSTATRETLGKASLSSASRFPLSSSTMKLKPVMLPPGLERLRTRPLFTGSAMRVMTMGIVVLAFLAACTDWVFTATITSTLSSTK